VSSTRRDLAPPPPPPPLAHTLREHARSAVVLLAITILVTGFAYPLFVTGVAQLVDPDAANGSLLYYPNNGTLAGSALVAQNTNAPYLFWERPSLTDYNFTEGAPTPPGPTQPGLYALLNETLEYMKEYGNFTVNATLPFWWVAPSESSIDPDLVPEAVLVQIPRVANATNLSIPTLQEFVNAHIVNPAIPDVGVPYVDVLQLDLALLPMIGK
jgi:potassium-transporting ATPase KdpC subunit